jgi:hypothetical protein
VPDQRFGEPGSDSGLSGTANHSPDIAGEEAGSESEHPGSAKNYTHLQRDNAGDSTARDQRHRIRNAKEQLTVRVGHAFTRLQVRDDARARTKPPCGALAMLRHLLDKAC